MTEQMTVVKLDPDGQEIWRWQGRVLARGETWIKLEAYFNAGEKDLGYVRFQEGDRFEEWYYRDRWYNIFEIHGAAGGALKGWYCNISRPARIEGDMVWHEDLALDLFVYPDGRDVLDDEDEFEALALGWEDRRAARVAVESLRAMAAAREAPFDKIAR